MAPKKKGPSSKSKGVKKGGSVSVRGKSAGLNRVKGYERPPLSESITPDVARDFKLKDDWPAKENRDSQDAGEEKRKSSLKPGDPGFRWTEEFAHRKDTQGSSSVIFSPSGSKKGPSAFVLDSEDLALFEHPSVMLRYGPLEMLARAMQAENMYSRVMLDASRRWCMDPQAGPLPDVQLKDPASTKANKYSERTRRLGRALSVIEATQWQTKPKPKKATPPEEEDSLWIGPLSGMAPSSALAAAYAVSTMRMHGSEDAEAKGAKAVADFERDVCIEEKEPCRRYFSIKCWPCPEHTPGVPREKTCICATEPRPQESFKDAVRFLGMLPRGMHVTYSSLDPERRKKVELRAQSEATWRAHIVQWKAEYEIAHLQAKNIIRNQNLKEHRPPFVEENQSLRRLRGMGSLPLHLV